MNTREMFDDVKRHLVGSDRHLDDKIMVKIAMPGVGGTRCTEVTRLIYGFDWDNGKIILETAAPLVTADDLTRLKKYAAAFEKLLAAYAHETEQVYMGQKLSQAMYPKGTTARIMKDLLKQSVDEYLHPTVPPVQKDSHA